MAKDSQIDPKVVRKTKAKDDPTITESGNDSGRNNNKKQSGNRHKPNVDK